MKSMLFIAVLALFQINVLTGCDGKKNETTAPAQAQITEISPNSSATLLDESRPSQRPLQNLSNNMQTASTTEVQNLIVGERIYKSTCGICHKSGLNGAPRMGKRDDWEARLAQGNEVLYERALNGYRGSKGSMPSRGSNPRLTETEVKAAVDYMIKNSIPAWSVE